MYDELDAQPDPEPVLVSVPAVSPVSSLSPIATELVGLLLKDDRERSLVASLAESQALQLSEARQDRQALVAALERIGSPVINVDTPEVTVHVPPAEVRVDVPAPEVTVNMPEIRVDVPAPQVTVRPEITVEAPATQKTVTFERDPLTQQVTRAEVTES